MWNKKVTSYGGGRRYYKYNQCTPGQVLVEDGVFIGMEKGNFGMNFIFRGEDGIEDVLNPSNPIKRWVDKGIIKEGGRYRIVFQGSTVQDGGPYKGKPKNLFDLFIASTPDSKPNTVAGKDDGKDEEGFDPDDALSSMTSEDLERFGL